MTDLLTQLRDYGRQIESDPTLHAPTPEEAVLTVPRPPRRTSGSWIWGPVTAAIVLLAFLPMILGRSVEEPNADRVDETPVLLPEVGAVHPGTYILPSGHFARAIVTLPDGWTTRDGFVYKNQGQPTEMALSAWRVGRVYDDPCLWKQSSQSEIDLSDDETHNRFHDAAVGETIPYGGDGGLSNQAYRGDLPRTLTVVDVGGQKALRIVLSVPADLNTSTCDLGEFRSWYGESVDIANSNHTQGQVDVIYMFDPDRWPFVIVASHLSATSDQDLGELESILGSMIVEY